MTSAGLMLPSPSSANCPSSKVIVLPTHSVLDPNRDRRRVASSKRPDPHRSRTGLLRDGGRIRRQTTSPAESCVVRTRLREPCSTRAPESAPGAAARRSLRRFSGDALVAGDEVVVAGHTGSGEKRVAGIAKTSSVLRYVQFDDLRLLPLWLAHARLLWPLVMPCDDYRHCAGRAARERAERGGPLGQATGRVVVGRG